MFGVGIPGQFGKSLTAGTLVLCSPSQHNLHSVSHDQRLLLTSGRSATDQACPFPA